MFIVYFLLLFYTCAILSILVLFVEGAWNNQKLAFGDNVNITVELRILQNHNCSILESLFQVGVGVIHTLLIGDCILFMSHVIQYVFYVVSRIFYAVAEKYQISYF